MNCCIHQRGIRKVKVTTQIISSPRFQMPITKNLPSLTNNRVCLRVFHHQCHHQKNKGKSQVPSKVALVSEMLQYHVHPIRSLVFD